tara:strand:- start:29 stop:247 length:219 start_codon:yes stop_codon:yes gene_type:complete
MAYTQNNPLSRSSSPLNFDGKGCAKDEGGPGCIDKDEKGWFIWNNKKGGIFKRCDSKEDCEKILRVPAVHGG